MRRRSTSTVARSRPVALVTYQDDAPAEDLVLATALRRRGLAVAHPRWSDPRVDWRAFRLAVVRSTWDYHLRRPEFLRWISRTARSVELWNPPRTLRWNTDKRYLNDLAAAGVPVPPTIRLTGGRPVDVERIFRRFPGRSIVVKPEVSGGGFATSRFGPRQRRAARAEIFRLLR
ncbi:MAG TPA: hypothetical protein VJQ43_02965, partial [Thermoplasmata archaeon]|nr:hypothetical protein [Thermoplasmata archaeon]